MKTTTDAGVFLAMVKAVNASAIERVASVEVKFGKVTTPKSFVMKPAGYVFVADALVIAAITSSEPAIVNSGVIRVMFFPAGANVFFTPSMTFVILTSVVIANANVGVTTTKALTIKTKLLLTPALSLSQRA